LIKHMTRCETISLQGIKMKLYDWQQEIAVRGKRILEDFNMLYLALFPRSGKSLITMQIIEDTYNNPKVLWVTPKSAIDGIVKVYHQMCMEYDIYVTNYEQLHKVTDTYNVIVVDEVHKIGAFPKPNKARKELDRIVNDKTDIIWLSGTPKIESNSSLFHQLSLSHYHPYSSYKSFYKWHKQMGIQGLTKWTGASRPAVDYSQTKDLSEHYEDILISDSRTAQNAFKLHRIYVSPPKEIKALYADMQDQRICEWNGKVSIANSGAIKQNKLLQITGGTLIMEDETTEHISSYKVDAIYERLGNKDVAVFYKYEGERILLEKRYGPRQLFQIDANSCGLDLSHFKVAAIMTPTFSGANFTQCMNRLTNVNREDVPEIYLFHTRTGVDKLAFDRALDKYNDNLQFLEE